ncbi:hypothetical protein HanHA300_Chr15g0583501 [Helianthus annuus]|nr:hypothetical protein HanHA300_Chr15g0583501 [Helianthus annuus]KAJ0474747.1 hypothetical protein HanHA89_Chr15g0633291 [Helianthus annuus]KAJ0650301.1 hypothetical protein HanLR1_Chr15g0594201 [Helianthus annuus]KAJ0654073.1 hypothetical protein HanOQP8_Chr15g0590811 [Helianthus annuus]
MVVMVLYDSGWMKGSHLSPGSGSNSYGTYVLLVSWQRCFRRYGFTCLPPYELVGWFSFAVCVCVKRVASGIWYQR